jgi:RsmE family RNA methyltransferase
MAHLPHLYLPRPWEEEVVRPADAQLHHLQRVLKARDGDPLSYTDGSGVVGAGWLENGLVRRGDESDRPRPSTLTVAVAPPASRHRVRFLVEKLAELGVARLAWVSTRYGEGRPPPASRAEAWAIAALEQSRGVWKMEVTEATLQELDRTRLVVADPVGGAFTGDGDVILLVGPEGGFHEDEIPAAVPRVSLGPTILRVETAALVGATLLRRIPPSSG